jgi:hypothetical protein
MQSHFNGLEDIQNRLLKLERQNRRLKQFGVAVLIASASLIVTGQAPSKKIIEANEFILRDDSGNVRARLSMGVPVGAAPGFPAVAQLILFDEKAKKRVAVNGGTSIETLGFAQRDPRSAIPGFSVFDEQERARGYFTETDASDLGPALQLLDAQGKSQIILELGEVEGDSVAASRVLVHDTDGFAATLGVTDLLTSRTGEKHKTSAASLILFDKDQKVLWRAP